MSVQSPAGMKPVKYASIWRPMESGEMEFLI